MTMRTLRIPRGSDDAHLLIGQALGQIIRRENPTESYVCCPPAWIVKDTDGSVLTMGFEFIEYPFHYEFMVLRDDMPTGQFAQFIERRGEVIRLYGKDGTRVLSRNKRHFI